MAILSWLSGSQSTGQAALPLPPGRRGAIPLLGQTLSFHDAAHDEVTSLVNLTCSSSVRLNVIARNVALVTAFEDAHKVLKQDWNSPPAVSRAQAYEQLMAAFYSAPNLLLEDEDMDGAQEHRQQWDESIQQALKDEKLQKKMSKIISEWLQRTTEGNGDVEDIYDACKDLGHDLALGTFLSLDSGSVASSTSEVSHDKLRSWSEEMLRGQFTLPIGLNVGFFQNAFSRGQAAKTRFDKVVEQQIGGGDGMQRCPFAVNPNKQLSTASLVSHHSMFSSSLVVKGFASIATALLMQLFRKTEGREVTLADRLCLLDEDAFPLLLESIITETERLSPPIIGVMRRVTLTSGIELTASQTKVPCGWDIWPYFPLANRDEKAFGADANLFKADRYYGQHVTPLPLTFGAGVKECAGQEIVRMWLRELVASLLGRRLHSSACGLLLDTDSIDKGVQSWLGWLPSGQTASWQGVKQLPTQRPRKAIAVRFAAKSDQSK